MSQVLRTAFAFAGLLAITVVAMIYATAGVQLYDLGKSSGEMSGPFSGIVEQLFNLMPLLLALFVAIVFIFWLVGSVQEERRVDRRRVR